MTSYKFNRCIITVMNVIKFLLINLLFKFLNSNYKFYNLNLNAFLIYLYYTCCSGTTSVKDFVETLKKKDEILLKSKL